MTTMAVVVTVLGLAIIAGVVFSMRRASMGEPVLVGASRVRKPPAPAREAWDETPAVTAAEPVAPDPPAEVVVAHVTWPERIQRTGETLDAEARLRLITDLGMLRAAWCVPILELASEEETDPDLRSAAQAALAKCRRADSRTPAPAVVHTAGEEEPTVSSNGHASVGVPSP